MRTLVQALCLSLFLVAAQPAAAAGKYLMAYHACNTETAACTNPTNHQTHVAESNDGTTWSNLAGFTAKPGSVPDIIRRGNRLFVFTAGRLDRFNLDTSAWETGATVSVRHSTGAIENITDPSLILDEQGLIVLFYLVSGVGGDPAQCASGEASCVKVFRSATEVPGSDGSRYVVDSGNRAEISVVSSSTLKSASDPDIFRGPSGYVLYISRGMSVQALTASALRGSYTNVPGLNGGMLVENAGGVPAGHYDATTGRYWTYVTTNQAGGIQVIRRAVTSTLGAAIPESAFSQVISGAAITGLGAKSLVASPGFLVNEPGPAMSGVSGDATGSIERLTLTATVSIAPGDIGKSGRFYVAALYRGLWFAHNGAGWVAWTGGDLPSYATATAFSANHTLPILQGTSVVGLAGVQVYAGYGTSLEDMLTNMKYGVVYSMP